MNDLSNILLGDAAHTLTRDGVRAQTSVLSLSRLLLKSDSRVGLQHVEQAAVYVHDAFAGMHGCASARVCMLVHVSDEVK
jgi:hypothetical protein